MNFSRISRATAFGALARWPLKLIPPSANLPILQGKLRGKRWIAGSHTHGCWLGSYEYDKRVAFENMIDKGSVVFDIGAHVGFYTLLASALVGPEGKVFAFEPLQRNVAFLRQHLAINHVLNVTVIEGVVSDCDGSACFSEGSGNAMGSIAPNGALTVTAVTVDRLLEARTVPVPDYMKIDVEGGELAVLRGSRRLLTEHRPTLFVATHGVDIHRSCCELLRTLGYALTSLSHNTLEETDEFTAEWTGGTIRCQS